MVLAKHSTCLLTTNNQGIIISWDIQGILRNTEIQLIQKKILNYREHICHDTPIDLNINIACFIYIEIAEMIAVGSPDSYIYLYRFVS